MHSLWEKQAFLTSDYLIIGAGITGLSAAATLKEKMPNATVTVLEKGILPTGASTKNAGFACFGSVSELINDIQTLGEKGMVSLVEKRWDGLQKTCQRLGRSEIDIQVKGGYELFFDENEAIHDQIEKVNGLLHPFFQTEVFRRADEKLANFRFGNTKLLIENQLEGQLDTGKLITSLWKYCNQLGVQVHTGCPVESIEEEHDAVSILCKDSTFKSSKVAICTNAFSKQLLPDITLDLNPGRGLVISVVTDYPISFEGSFHYDEGYYYFRDYYGKIIFGGGRNIALEEENTLAFGINDAIKEKLISDLEEIIIPSQAYAIEMEWSGIMAFGSNKSPIVTKISDRVALGARLGGMGVAIGSLVGEEVAELLFED